MGMGRGHGMYAAWVGHTAGEIGGRAGGTGDVPVGPGGIIGGAETNKTNLSHCVIEFIKFTCLSLCSSNDSNCFLYR
jgi:hypothetical protein